MEINKKDYNYEAKLWMRPCKESASNMFWTNAKIEDCTPE